MLDVSIRAGVLNMMTDLREQEDVSILYITHDLASARYVADRIVVMYAGHLVETGPSETVLAEPKHPYTQLLLSAVAESQQKAEEISADTGEPPKVINPTEGCRFRWRCPYAIEKCARVTPRPRQIGSVQVACHVAAGEPEDLDNPAGTASVTHSQSYRRPLASSDEPPANTV
jgi:oligopeptide/dipeptide ABC transporter ATP-binding protein